MSRARLESIRMQAIAGAWCQSATGEDIMEYLRCGAFGGGARDNAEPYSAESHKARVESLLRGQGL